MQNATELVRDLQEMRDQGYLSDALLRHAVKAIGAADDRFDWIGGFLVRENGESIWLHNYVGGPAEYAEVPVGEGVWGSAVAAGEDRIIVDPTALPEQPPCNPDVRSQLVVLIRAGTEVFGGIEVASEQEGAFGEAEESGVRAIADKLAEQIAAERR